MNFELLTPHQASDYLEFIDTVLVCGDSGVPLDIASPQAASRLISQTLASSVADTYRGRMTVLDVAAGTYPGFPVEYWATMAQNLIPTKVQYGILIVDRLYLQDKLTIELREQAMRWFVFDWYQWLVKHVPGRRLVDSFMYLSMASNLYRNSNERRQLGIADSDARAMGEEGRRLMTAMIADACSEIEQLWEKTDVDVKQK